AARTPQEYEAAINHLLSFLNDRNTRAEIRAEAKTNPAANNGAAKEPLRLENGVMIIDAAQIAGLGATDGKAYGETLQKIPQMLPQAKSMVFDLRGAEELSGDEAATIGYFTDGFMRTVLPQILDANVTLGSTRYRMHNGYAPQTGFTSGGYFSAFAYSTPGVLDGRGKTKMPPAVFIINDKTLAVGEFLSGLQAAEKAVVVQEGDLKEELGVATYAINLPDNVRVKMRTVELVNADGSVGFQADLVVPKAPDGRDAALAEALKTLARTDFKRPANKNSVSAALQTNKDKTYAEMEFPGAEYRLLALFRYWTVINYFYPYKDLIDKPWDEVLPKYIPKFEANKDAADYQLTVQQMVGEMQDSHGGVRFPTLSKSGEKLGRYYPPLFVRFVENQSVVLEVLEPNTGIEKGDVILRVDGETVEKYRENAAIYFSASTNQALQRVLHIGFLRGQKDTKVKLTVRGLDGKTRDVEVTRNIVYNDPRWTPLNINPRKTPVFEVLPSGFGYVDLARLEVRDVDKMFETIKNAPAAIFDMRGYPRGTAWAIAPRLTEKKNVAAALFSRPILIATDLSNGEDLRGLNYTFTQYLPEASGDVYKGKVVMLIDENAISQSEHTAMFFEAATNVTFIGTPTTGANGDVTTLTLPGNLGVSFTGHNVRHADGRQLQRVGIQPTIKVAPTIRGTLAGKDEILEAAVKFLQTQNK
ncbi:MAG TPA: S41 family peptidase, partial [Pyrinomonadaceae bacterium]